MLRATVVIPTYNRVRSLVQVLQALERQTASLSRYEVVVVLDGCTDETESALATYKPPFELRWHQQENSGLAAARNRGAQHARHEVLLFVDDDVLPDPGLVAAHLQAHEQHAGVIVQGYMPIPEGWSQDGATLLYARRYEEAMSLLREGVPGQWHLWSGNISIRRQTFERVGGFDPALFRRYGGEDTDFSLRAAALRVDLLFDRRASAEHRQRVSSRRSLASQAFWEGFSRVVLARRHDLALESFAGCTPERLGDHLVVAAWRLPWLAKAAGQALVGLLWLADHCPFLGARIFTARLLSRHYRLGGVIQGLRDAWPPPLSSAGAPPQPFAPLGGGTGSAIAE
jgi:GT2 family glycosyltransferase